MAQAARSFALQDQWPEALVIYPQGLKTPGLLTDSDGKRNGWQMTTGGHGDRDLAFVDAILASLRKEPGIDETRIYATGHSNGGGFTYLLWAQRPEVFAALAPVAATPALGNLPTVPKPVLHIAGKADPLVKFAWQERTIQMVRKLNGCGSGEPWPQDKSCTLYPSAKGAPVVTRVHDGGHKYPAEAPGVIVRFFKANRLP
jgi:polyhydroxybutyrate depolymerase